MLTLFSSSTTAEKVIVLGTEGAFLWTTIGGLLTFGPLALGEALGAAEPTGAASAVGVAEGCTGVTAVDSAVATGTDEAVRVAPDPGLVPPVGSEACVRYPRTPMPTTTGASRPIHNVTPGRRARRELRVSTGDPAPRGPPAWASVSDERTELVAPAPAAGRTPSAISCCSG